MEVKITQELKTPKSGGDVAINDGREARGAISRGKNLIEIENYRWQEVRLSTARFSLILIRAHCQADSSVVCTKDGGG